MTTGPQLRIGRSLLPGLLAVALFGLMAAIVVATPFGGADAVEGFPEGISITAEIGAAMFGFDAIQSTEGNIPATEPFLVSVLLIAVVLDAALDASLVLAKREQDGEPVAALAGAEAGAHTEEGTGVGPGPAAADGGSSPARDGTASDGGDRA